MIFFVSVAYGVKTEKCAKIMNMFGQSKFIQCYSNYVQKNIDRCNLYGDELASLEYQALGQQAQQALGIKQELQLPIKKIKGPSVISAVVGSDGIYMNEDRLNNRSFGSKRCTFFHEAVHAKYYDAWNF